MATRGSVPASRCDICLNLVPENMMNDCRQCSAHVCSQCFDDYGTNDPRNMCIECSWNIMTGANCGACEGRECIDGKSCPYGIIDDSEVVTGTGRPAYGLLMGDNNGQGMWKLAIWNLHFSGAHPMLILSDDDVAEACAFLVRSNYPKPADCPWKNCPEWKYTCDSTNICQIAIRMCANEMGVDIDEADQSDIVNEARQRLAGPGPGKEIDLLKVVGNCPECGGQIMNKGFWDLECAKCGLSFSALAPDVANIVEEECRGCGATSDCRSYGPASQGCGNSRGKTWDADPGGAPRKRGQVFSSGLNEPKIITCPGP